MDEAVINTGPSKFTRFPYAPQAPGSCIACNSSTKPVVDLGISVRFYGRAYLCEDCLHEIMALIGLVGDTATAQQQRNEWVAEGYQKALNERWGESLGDLVRTLSGLADRLDRARAGHGPALEDVPSRADEPDPARAESGFYAEGVLPQLRDAGQEPGDARQAIRGNRGGAEPSGVESHVDLGVRRSDDVPDDRGDDARFRI